MKKNKFLKIIIGFFILFISIYGGIYMLTISSESYNAADALIRSNQKINSKIGVVTNTQLSLWGYYVHYNGPDGLAKFKIFTVGDRGSGTVYINIEKTVGVWKITEGNLILDNGVSMSLTDPITVAK